MGSRYIQPSWCGIHVRTSADEISSASWEKSCYSTAWMHSRSNADGTDT